MMVQTLSYALTHDDEALWARLDWYAQQEGIRLIESTKRKEVPPQEPDSETGTSEAEPVLKISRARTSVLWQGEELFFHPGMALLRLLGELRGEKDRFLQASGLKSGDTCVDATMGLASDTLMAAWRIGRSGRILALEASPVIAALTKEGLDTIAQTAPRNSRGLKGEAWQHLIQAAGRVEIHLCDHLAFLRAQERDAFQVVFFDPMFRHTREQSASMRPLKPWIRQEALKTETIQEACRTAHRVVLKERNGSAEFSRLGFTVEPGGRYSPVAFGVIARH